MSTASATGAPVNDSAPPASIRQSVGMSPGMAKEHMSPPVLPKVCGEQIDSGAPVEACAPSARSLSHKSCDDMLGDGQAASSTQRPGRTLWLPEGGTLS